MDRTLMAGAGKMNITPPFGCEMSGFVARQGNSVGIHDELWARALVIDDGRRKIALVTADLIGIDRSLLAKVREALTQWTDIEPEALILSATHTHSGPAVLSEAFLGVPEPQYLDSLARNIAGAVAAANQSLEPVRLALGSSECRAVGKNRRKDERLIDPQVLTVRFDSKAGLRALLVNYACHPVVLGPDNRRISGDYPSELVTSLERIYPGTQIMFVNGAAGDINVGHKTEDSIKGLSDPKRTFGEAVRMGKLVAAAAIQAVETALPVEASAIGFRSRRINLPLEPLPSGDAYRDNAARLRQLSGDLRRQGANYGEIQQATLWGKWAERMAAYTEHGALAPEASAEIAALKLGEIELITLPGEFFHEFGLNIKEARAPRKVVILGYSNGALGYVAPRYVYKEGGYEVVDSYRYYGLPARIAEGDGEKVVATLLQMLEGLAEEPQVKEEI
jgi:neutral ceramidase